MERLRSLDGTPLDPGDIVDVNVGDGVKRGTVQHIDEKRGVKVYLTGTLKPAEWYDPQLLIYVDLPEEKER